jgi:hypothetical protein
MLAEHVKQLIDRRPFAPLRLQMADGADYVIRQPENILVTKSWLNIGVAADAAGIVDHVDYFWLPDVVRMEDMPAHPVE